MAPPFLAYLLGPEAATAIAFAAGTCNSVAQMGDPAVMRAFSAAQLDAIQWDTIEEDIGRCAAYTIAPSYDALLARLVTARPTAGRQCRLVSRDDTVEITHYDFGMSFCGS